MIFVQGLKYSTIQQSEAWRRQWSFFSRKEINLRQILTLSERDPLFKSSPMHMHSRHRKGLGFKESKIVNFF